MVDEVEVTVHELIANPFMVSIWWFTQAGLPPALSMIVTKRGRGVDVQTLTRTRGVA